MGLAGMMLAAVYLAAAAVVPPAPGFAGQEAFSIVLSSSWRIWLAGWCAYTVSQRLDVWIYLALKRTGIVGQAVVTRAGVSLTIGQFVDTALFVTVAFVGKTPLLPVILGQYAVKLALACVAVPLVGVTVAVARRLVAGDEATTRAGAAACS
jgi:hypothetical protein